MKINQLFETQLDEGPIGQAIAKGVGGVAKGIGATVGGAAGAWQQAKAGYQAGKAAVSGQPAPAATAPNVASTAPATDAVAPGGATTAPVSGGAVSAPTTTGSTPAKGTADFGTIQRSIKTLSPKQKTALSTQLSGGKPAVTPAAPATTPEAPAASTTPVGPQKGQEVSLEGGEKYRFLGQQWVEVDPATGAEMGGAALPAGFQKSLTGIAAKQSAAPAATTGAPDLKVIPGGKSAMGEGYYRSKFLNVIL